MFFLILSESSIQIQLVVILIFTADGLNKEQQKIFIELSNKLNQ